jgi:hypothetical protein
MQLLFDLWLTLSKMVVDIHKELEIVSVNAHFVAGSNGYKIEVQTGINKNLSHLMSPRWEGSFSLGR